MTDISKLTCEELMFEVFRRGVSCVINVRFECKENGLHIQSTTQNPINALGGDFTKTKVIFKL